jgi:hypothetical protein
MGRCCTYRWRRIRDYCVKPDKAEEALAIADAIASEFVNPFVIEGREIVGAISSE